MINSTLTVHYTYLMEPAVGIGSFVLRKSVVYINSNLYFGRAL